MRMTLKRHMPDHPLKILVGFAQTAAVEGVLAVLFVILMVFRVSFCTLPAHINKIL